MSIGNHTKQIAEIVILSGVEGGLYEIHVSTSLNMTGAMYNQMFINHCRYSYTIIKKPGTLRATTKIIYKRLF